MVLSFATTQAQITFLASDIDSNGCISFGYNPMMPDQPEGVIPVFVVADQSNMVGFLTNVNNQTTAQKPVQTSGLFYGPNEGRPGTPFQ